MVVHRSVTENATLIANGGAGPGSGGTIIFKGNFTSGGQCRVEVFGNGNLDVSRPDPAADYMGSIEGDDLIFLGGSELTVGGNNMSTNFSGVISDTGGIHQATGGSLAKTGSGMLHFSSANTYTGSTTVHAGVFQ